MNRLILHQRPDTMPRGAPLYAIETRASTRVHARANIEQEVVDMFLVSETRDTSPFKLPRRLLEPSEIKYKSSDHVGSERSFCERPRFVLWNFTPPSVALTMLLPGLFRAHDRSEVILPPALNLSMTVQVLSRFSCCGETFFFARSRIRRLGAV